MRGTTGRQLKTSGQERSILVDRMEERTKRLHSGDSLYRGRGASSSGSPVGGKAYLDCLCTLKGGRSPQTGKKGDSSEKGGLALTLSLSRT